MKLPKNISVWINTILLLIAFATVFYKFGGYELRLHSSPEQRIEAEEFVDELKVTLKESIKREMKRDSMAEIFVKGMAKLDTLSKEIKETQQLNTVTNFQTKENTEAMKEYWDNYLREKEEEARKAKPIEASARPINN